MTDHDLVEHVAAHAGVESGEASTATRVVLSAIAGYLGSPARGEIAQELPPTLRASWLAGDDHALPLEEHLLGPGRTVAQVRELIGSVCYVLSERFSREALAAIRVATPPELARWFAATESEVAHDEQVPGLRETLARGRPGSHHPIADTPAQRVQSGSVAVPNPHGSRKLSSFSPER
jgi:uncharacterized protein (DUF2267 family)